MDAFNPVRYKFGNSTIKCSQAQWDKIFGKKIKNSHAGVPSLFQATTLRRLPKLAVEHGICPACLGQDCLVEIRGHIECKSSTCNGRVIESCCEGSKPK